MLNVRLMESRISTGSNSPAVHMCGGRDIAVEISAVVITTCALET